MRTQQIRGIILLLAIVFSAALYKAATPKPQNPGLQKAQMLYEAERFQLKRENLRRYNMLKFYGAIGLFAAINLSLLILSGAYARARIKISSVHTARIGQHSAIPVHYKDLQSFYPIAINLSLAEIEASVSSSHENAYQISRQMIEDITSYTRSIAGKRGMGFSEYGQPITVQSALPAPTSASSFAELLRNGTMAPGKPLVLGFSQGQPQYRDLKDLKSVAVAGWQGSGKTLSTAYIVASSVLAYGVHAYIVDPHKNHEEGLYALLKPLEKTGHVTIINPFDTPTLIKNLSTILERRLSGEDPSSPGILLVIDELARLAKMECFDTLVTFLERCTEETRKANITFIGCSHKWTARHFKGRADIRGCMNSMLIHKTKPSQADLLVEDSQDKYLVKQIQQPGEAILITDFDQPVLVSMPVCTREDMEIVAEIVKKTYATEKSPALHLETQKELRKAVNSEQTFRQPTTEKKKDTATQTAKSSSTKKPVAAPQVYPKDVIPFDLHRKKAKLFRQSTVNPDYLTLEQIQQQLQKRKEFDPTFTQAELARQTEISPGHLSKILREQRPLNKKNKQKLYNALFASNLLKKPAIRR